MTSVIHIGMIAIMEPQLCQSYKYIYLVYIYPDSSAHAISGLTVLSHYMVGDFRWIGCDFFNALDF